MFYEEEENEILLTNRWSRQADRLLMRVSWPGILDKVAETIALDLEGLQFPTFD